jgi:ABC-type cobalamin transport system ATPase subunit
VYTYIEAEFHKIKKMKYIAISLIMLSKLKRSLYHVSGGEEDGSV